MTVRIPYVSSFKDRHGKTRWRFRRGSVSVYLPDPTSLDFAPAYQAALAAKPVIRPRYRRGSMSDLIVRYLASPEFARLAAPTKSVYRNVLKRLDREHGDKLVAQLEPRHVRALVRAKAETPTAANRLLSILNILLSLAVEEDMIRLNPASQVKKLPVKTQGFIAWSQEDVEAFEARHGPGTRERLALRLLLCTGQRRSDVVRMGWQHVEEGWIRVVQQKTGVALSVPLLPQLTEELARLPRDRLTFLLTKQGAPFTAAGFGNWFGEAVAAAGLAHRSAHGLRKTAAYRLAEAGCTAHEIKAITGHQTLREVQRYTAAADQKRLAAAAMAQLAKRQSV